VQAIAQARQLQQLELNNVQGVATAALSSLTALTSLCHLGFIIIIIIKLPNQAIASTPSALRPTGAAERGSTAPWCVCN
jgi:hypothetical protein